MEKEFSLNSRVGHWDLTDDAAESFIIYENV